MDVVSVSGWLEHEAWTVVQPPALNFMLPWRPAELQKTVPLWATKKQKLVLASPWPHAILKGVRNRANTYPCWRWAWCWAFSLFDRYRWWPVGRGGLGLDRRLRCWGFFSCWLRRSWDRSGGWDPPYRLRAWWGSPRNREKEQNI